MAAISPATPINSPVPKIPQANGCGTPPFEMLRQSHMKEISWIAPPETKRVQGIQPTCGGFFHNPNAPPIMSDAATIAGASTGADQGTGRRKSKSQVNRDCGQEMRSLSDA